MCSGMDVAQALVSRAALRHNLKQLRSYSPQSKMMAVVKANAYGHGVEAVVNTLTEADGYGVARASEAVALREAGVTKPLLVLEGFFSAEEALQLSQHGVAVALHSEEQLRCLEQSRLPAPLEVWVKIDTGMHRLGLLPEQWRDLLPRIQACRNIQQPVKLMSHFACADEPEHPLNRQQQACFDEQQGELALETSFANSAGILFHPQSHGSWNRPGIALYGISPQVDSFGRDFKLIPAMTMQSTVIAVREHPKGGSVGYGASWQSEHATRLGVVAMGYGDGYPRTAPSGTPVWVNGREVPIVGRVSMDMLCVELGPEAQDRPGDRVVLWGPELPAEKVAASIGTIAYELVTNHTQRVALRYLDD